MSSQLSLPSLHIKPSKAYIDIMASWLFIGKATKHEYALLLTITRLNLKINEDYNRARQGVKKYYSDSNSLNLSALITFTNYIESVITDI